MKQPAVLCFCTDAEEEKKIRACAVMNRILFRKADADMKAKPLGALFTLPESGSVEGEGSELPDRMLVMAFFTPDLMNRFLGTLKTRGAASGWVKAVLTATNAMWTPDKLKTELDREKAALENGQKAVHG